MAVSINRAHSRHGSRRRSTGQAFTDINVTPFVDVMLVLLVIFMVTAPMLTVGVPVDLPKTKAARMNDQVEPLVVTVDASGKSFLSETELEGDALIERLIAVSGSNPDAKIYVRGDQKINYGRVMEVMGIIAAAGFNKVSLIAEMPTGPDTSKNLKVHHPAPPASPSVTQAGQFGSHVIPPQGVIPGVIPPQGMAQPTPTPAMGAPVMPSAPPQRVQTSPVSQKVTRTHSNSKMPIVRKVNPVSSTNGPKVVRSQ
jgi:biopolymer transport protein TolR